MVMARNDRGSLLHLLHRAGQCAADIFAAEITEADLTPRQLAVLIAVAGDEGASQTRLTDATGIDRSTLADIVKRLQRKGLLRRQRTRDDARAYAVALTADGRQLLRTAEPVAKRVDERLLSAIPDKQRETFLAALASIVEAITPAAAKSSRAA
jgi:DNA-binding MarR family transcriptional regulator